MDNKKHLKIEGYSTSNPYTTPVSGRGAKFLLQERDRATHGNFLLQKINEIKDEFEIEEIETSTLVKDDSIYLEFESDWGYPLLFDSFDSSGFQILNIKEEEREISNKTEYRYSLVVVIKEGVVSNFIKKIEDYISGNFIKTDRNTKEKIDTGNPLNQKLIENIDDIKRATLKSFWVDGQFFDFPNEDEVVWWEVWFRKNDNYEEKLVDVQNNLELLECQIGQSEIVLADHVVRLVKGTANQLSKSLLLLDNLAELRKPQEIPNFILDRNVPIESKNEYLADLLERTESKLDDNSVLICLLDTGVNNQHPLLKQFLPDSHLYTYNNAWGTNDSNPNGGHGTPVAGLALYGDLTNIFDPRDNIQIYHGLESFKVLFNDSPNDPELYGAITESGINSPIIDRPNNLRVYCLTITDPNFRMKGRPSAWSSAIDKICFGKDSSPQLFIVSGGNVQINNFQDYPIVNFEEPIHDPAQAYNAITVGTFTRKDKIDVSSGYRPLAEYGAMAPSNSTSLLFDKNWANKPDIVFEGGNLAYNELEARGHENLDVLSLHKDFRNKIFNFFGDTSGAAGLASKMAAELRTLYSNFWPETIRGLMIHSAEWTTKMLGGREINKLKEQEKTTLLRTVGYGVPNISKAKYCANNSLILIAEREIQPYKLEKSKGQYNQYHLFELPWPKEALEQLEGKNAKLIVTLSYYIEPNPGTRRLATNYAYHSHQLDFEIINSLETLDEFKVRISKPKDETKENRTKRTGVKWAIGKDSNLKGSIRKDFINGTGRELSVQNILAVMPKNGWYKNLKRQNKHNEVVRYSLIVSIETEETEVDLYTPVFNILNPLTV
jgi:hypothetical protein